MAPPRGWRETAEEKKTREGERASERARGVGGKKKEEQGFGIDVIVSVRHPSRSSSPRPAARAIPPYPPTTCRPDRKLPLATGAPAIQATFSSLLCFSSRVLPHIDYNITTYPSFPGSPPIPSSSPPPPPPPRVSPSCFFLFLFFLLFPPPPPPRRRWYASFDIYVHF